MDIDDYFWKTKKRSHKTKPRAKPLPKAKEKYLEAEETLFQELEEYRIGYRRKFQFESTRNWRFDFYIVKLNLLIEIAGSPWSVGRGGRSAGRRAGGRRGHHVGARCRRGVGAQQLQLACPDVADRRRPRVQ